MMSIAILLLTLKKKGLYNFSLPNESIYSVLKPRQTQTRFISSARLLACLFSRIDEIKNLAAKQYPEEVPDRFQCAGTRLRADPVSL
jgi:hypothetical protein